MQFGDVTLHSFNGPNLIQLFNEPAKNSEVHLHFIAVSSINAAIKSGKLTSVLNEGISIIDSKPLALALRILGFECNNLRGTDFLRFAIQSDQGEKRHFLIGSTSETLEKIRIKAKQINPKFQIVGTISPSFRQHFEEDYPQWGARFSQSQANVVWIGLGSPKQDFLAYDLTNRFGIRTVAVGAAFDFFSESVKEAPLIMQRMSLEWLFRLLTEPKRLWKRYLLGNLYFLIKFITLFVNLKFKQSIGLLKKM